MVVIKANSQVVQSKVNNLSALFKDYSVIEPENLHPCRLENGSTTEFDLFSDMA